MSLKHSPSVVTDGLVLYYDMHNTKKSFKGAPTVNLLTSPTNEVNGSTSEFVQYVDLAPILNTYGTSVVYSLSLDLKVKNAGSVTVYMQNGSGSKYSLVNAQVTATEVYQRFTFNSLSAAISSTTETLAILAFYGGYGSGVVPSIKNVQIEISPFASPFVSGTRTDTQTLLDLTGNNILTSSGLTYNSDNTFSFNGSSGLIDCGLAPAIKPTNAITVSTWVKFWSLSANTRMISDWHQSGGSGDRWIFYIINSTVVQWYLYTSAGPTAISYAPTLGAWVNLVGTYDGVTQAFYANSELIGSIPKSGLMPTGVANETVRIGKQAETGGYHNGYIPQVSMYNRALSSIEIKQNFNAMRGRFGI